MRSLCPLRVVVYGLIVPTAVTVLGCASVRVTRINDSNRNTADGFRYYLPRPYVVVKKEFSVAGGDFFVPAIVENGRFVIHEKELTPEIRANLTLAGVGTVIAHTDVRVAPSLLEAADVVDPTVPVARQSSTPQTSSTATTPSPSVANDAVLAGSTVSPAGLAAEQSTFQVVAKLAKAVTGTTIAVADPAGVVVGLVPFDEAGAPQPAKFVGLNQLPSSSTPWSSSADGSYTAVGSRDAIPAPGAYAIAAKLNGTIGAASGTNVVLHQSRASFFVVGPTKKGSSGDGDKQDAPKDKEQSGQAEYGGTKAMFGSAGDPQTDPLVSLKNGLFDILYLPDLEEQYAVKLSGGLGTASLQWGLENGWMMERAATQVDNTELGKFIFRNIDKFTDIGAIALKAAINPVLAGIPASSNVAKQSNIPGTTATLRISFTLEAQPGVYPLLKLSEVENKFLEPEPNKARFRSGKISRPYLFEACPPDTRVSYSVRRALSVQLMSLKPPADIPATAKGIKCDPAATPVIDALKLERISTGLTAMLAALGVSQDLQDQYLASIEQYGISGKTLVLCTTKGDATRDAAIARLASAPIDASLTTAGITKIEIK